MGIQTDNITATTSSTVAGVSNTDIDSRLSLLENLIAINTLRDSVDAGWTILDMIDGIADEYEDETGIDTVTTTAIHYSNNSNYRNEISSTLLLHMDDTGLTDSSVNNYSMVNYNNASRSDTQSKFGGYSMSVNANSRLHTPDVADFDFGTGDFTIDFWMYTTSFPTFQHIVGRWGVSNDWYCALTGSRLDWYIQGLSINLTVSSVINLNTWYHIALIRNGTSFKIYVDGVEKASGTDAGAVTYTSGEGMSIGGATINGNGLIGYMDEVRVLKGTAYWTSNFTPPTAAYTPSDDYLIQSESFTADAEPDYARLVILREDISGSTLNTDIVASISRDGGTTWTEATLTNDADFNATTDVLTTGDIDISGQPAGTSMKYKIETFNNKFQTIHGTWMQWR